MKRNIAIALAILCTLLFSVYCYSQQMPSKVTPPKKASAEGKEVTVSQKTVMTDFATVYITKEAGQPVVTGKDGTYSKIKIFKTYKEFEKYLSMMPPNSVPLVFDITLSPGVNYYGVAMAKCSVVGGKVFCQ